MLIANIQGEAEEADDFAMKGVTLFCWGVSNIFALLLLLPPLYCLFSSTIPVWTNEHPFKIIIIKKRAWNLVQTAVVQSTPAPVMSSEHTSSNEAPLPPDTRAPTLKSVITEHSGEVVEGDSFMSRDGLVLPPGGKVPVPEFVTST